MLRSLVFSIACLLAATAAGDPLIELTSSGTPIQGRRLAHNRHVCWLGDIDGRLIEVKLSTVTDFREVAPSFQARSVMEARKLLAQELGTGFEYAIRGSHVVAGPRGKANSYAQLLDQTSREFLQYLRIRRFDVTTPDVPLIAIVFPTRAQFNDQCRRDDIQPTATLRGYYNRDTNRVVLYDDPLEIPLADSSAIPLSAAPAPTHGMSAEKLRMQPQANSATDGTRDTARETAVHEAIHQIAFNAGIHSRIGENPLWVVEGLAMHFERGAQGVVKSRMSDHINLERLQAFDVYRRERRQAGALAHLIAGDESFRTAPLDAYAEAWMLTNFLIETRSKKYGWFLKTLSTRSPLEKFPSDERLRDFQSNLGEDLAWLEVEFLRYAEKMAVEVLPRDSTKK